MCHMHNEHLLNAIEDCLWGGSPDHAGGGGVDSANVVGNFVPKEALPP